MNTTNRFFIALLGLMAVTLQCVAADTDIVIQQLETTYKFIPTKDGDKVERIDINEQRHIAPGALMSLPLRK